MVLPKIKYPVYAFDKVLNLELSEENYFANRVDLTPLSLIARRRKGKKSPYGSIFVPNTFKNFASHSG